MVMNADVLFNECLENVSKDVSIEIDLSFDIAKRLDQLLTKRGISQKEFAEMLGKKESEVSKWLKGTHNFTLRTLAKITATLNEPLIEVVGTHKVIKEYVYVNQAENEKFYIIKDKGQNVCLPYSSNKFTYLAVN